MSWLTTRDESNTSLHVARNLSCTFEVEETYCMKSLLIAECYVTHRNKTCICA